MSEEQDPHLDAARRMDESFTKNEKVQTMDKELGLIRGEPSGGLIKALESVDKLSKLPQKDFDVLMKFIESRQDDPVFQKMLGGAVLATALRRRGQARVHVSEYDPGNDPRLHTRNKVDPDEFFISAGLREGLYYACLMRPTEKVKPTEVLHHGSDPRFKITAQMNVGYTTSDEAKRAAARMLPSVPVLIGNQFQWPFYTKTQEVSSQKQIEKEKRRAINFAKGRKKPNNGDEIRFRTEDMVEPVVGIYRNGSIHVVGLTEDNERVEDFISYGDVIEWSKVTQ